MTDKKTKKISKKIKGPIATIDVSKPKKFDDGVTTFFHAVNAGDIIASLAGLRQHYRDTGNKILIYQQLDKEGHYYPGATHPLTDESGRLVTMNRKMFDMLRPLLVSQEYIEDFKVWEGQAYEINLNRIHDGLNINMPHGSINRWIFYAFPDLSTDLSEKWLHVPKILDGNPYGINRGTSLPFENKMVLNFTERYRNGHITYRFLKRYEPHLVFLGTETEHQKFCSAWNITAQHIKVKDFLELASIIYSAKCFLGNQSMCWNIAEALKAPRELEICGFAENCIPVGKYAFDDYYQGGIEHHVHQLFNLKI